MGKDLGNGVFKDVVVEIKRKTASAWTFQNPKLADGEPGYELDTRRLKIGNGVQDWVNLPYFGTNIPGVVTSVNASTTGALSVAGGPITGAGTLAFTWNGSAGQYVLGDGSLASIPSLAGLVPYTGAISAVNLNTQNFSTQGLTNLGNASATNQKIVRIGQGTSFIDIGEVAGAFPGMWFQQTGVPGGANYTMGGDMNDLLFNASSSIQLRFNNTGRFNMVNQAVGTTSQDFLSLTPPNYTPSSTIEHRTFRILARTRTWPSAGTIASNRENLIEATTYTSASVVTMTDVFTLKINTGIAAGSVTITNNWALGLSGNLQMLGNIGTDTTTGMKMAITSAQKLGLWGVTPIIQPTQTGTSAVATYNFGGGSNLTDTDTFGVSLWTWAKFIQAIFNTGLLNS